MLGEANHPTDQRKIVRRNLELTNNYAAGQLLHALRETAVAEEFLRAPVALSDCAASRGVREDLLRNICAFLALRGIMRETAPDTFVMVVSRSLYEDILYDMRAADALVQTLRNGTAVAPPERTAFGRVYGAARMLMELERLNVLGALAGAESFSAGAAAQWGIDARAFETMCLFLSEHSFFQRHPRGFAFAPAEYYVTRLAANFLLAYRAMYEASRGLLDGSAVYGRDVVRDGSFLKNTGSYADMAIYRISERLRALGSTNVLDVGCGGGDLLCSLARSVPHFRGTGIDMDAAALEACAHRTGAMCATLKADGSAPNSFFEQVPQDIDVITSLALFHEFRKERDVAGILAEYKVCFPRARFFLVEFDVPSWQVLRAEPFSLGREIAGFYLITHHMSEQGLPQTAEAWQHDFRRAGWRVENTHRVFNRLSILECA